MSLVPVLLHIPHSSYVIPPRFWDSFRLRGVALEREQLRMTDTCTYDLFDLPCRKVVFPFSRLVCDVERFRDPSQEEMTQRGMWVCYTTTSDMRPLKTVSRDDREYVLQHYYDKHHAALTRSVADLLERKGKCLIVDCHSFASRKLPYELHGGEGKRPDICIGTDDFHTPPELARNLADLFTRKGYTVGVNDPFSGALVPLQYYRKDVRVTSVMIELNRSLYMDEKTGERTGGYVDVQRDINCIVGDLAGEDFALLFPY